MGGLKPFPEKLVVYEDYIKDIKQNVSQLIGPHGVIGWWEVDYPVLLPPTGSKPLTIRYTAGSNFPTEAS
jgi:hypothetical protein